MIGLGALTHEAALLRLLDECARKLRGRLSCCVEHCPTFGVVGERLRTGRVHLLFVDPQTPGGPHGDSATIEWFKRAIAVAGSVPLVVWTPEGWLGSRSLLELGRLGLREVLQRGEEDHVEIVEPLIWKLAVNRRFEALVRALPPSVPARVASYLGALTILHEEWVSPTSELMGQALNWHRSTVFRRFAAAGLPSPAQLLGWVRVYLVSCLVEEGVRLEEAVMRVGFSSVWNFRRMALDRMGVALTDEASVVALGSPGVLGRFSDNLRGG